MSGEADLLEVVDALGASGCLADLLDRGEEQADQDGDDRDHHQQLDQGEAAPMQRRRRTGAHGSIPGMRYGHGPATASSANPAIIWSDGSQSPPWAGLGSCPAKLGQLSTSTP